MLAAAESTGHWPALTRGLLELSHGSPEVKQLTSMVDSSQKSSGVRRTTIGRVGCNPPILAPHAECKSLSLSHVEMVVLLGKGQE